MPPPLAVKGVKPPPPPPPPANECVGQFGNRPDELKLANANS